MTVPVKGDIAIIGMSALYPGAGSLRQFWENILNKVDAISDAPEDWHPELFCDPDSDSIDRSYTRRGGFLKELAEFDPIEFGVIPNSIDGSVPDHFLSLRTAYEAIVDAGYGDPERLRPFQERTEVVLGHGAYIGRGHGVVMQRWVAVDAALRVLKQLHPEHTEEELAKVRQQLLASMPELNTDNLSGLVPNVVSGRIANRLNLMGATFNVDGACASSLLAIDIACRELLTGRCDMALAGGVHAASSSPIFIIFSQLKGLSRKGQIRSFDSEADGTLLSEGAGFAVLKRCEDAERAGDRIYAIIKGVGVSSDGRAMGLLAPRPEGEELAIQRAYEAAGVDPSTIGLIEGHGTATLVGDATELEVLNRVFGARSSHLPRCALGTVKSMIGHSIPASGMAGVIKMALALHHKVLPPTINCHKPNPRLQTETSNLYLNTETRPWIHTSTASPRRAAVNAFGFGGINTHAVLEEHTPLSPQTFIHHTWDSELFIVTAEAGALAGELEKLRRFVANYPDELCLKDLAGSLNTKPLAPARLAIIATSRKDLEAKLERAARRFSSGEVKQIRDPEGIYYTSDPLGVHGKLAFVFPGEGAQYLNMLLDLSLHFPEVRETFELFDRAYLDHPRGFLPSELLVPIPMQSASSGQAERLYSMDLGAEAVSCGNEAMFQLLTNLGVRPDMMVGHSTGEHSALRCAGVAEYTDEKEIVASVRAINAIFEKLKAAGQIPECSLLAIGGADHKRLKAMVDASAGRLYLAIDNCPNQFVLCGDPESIDDAVRELSSTPAICQKLPFSRAYHSPAFSVFSEHLRGYFNSIRVSKPRVPLYSCVTADVLPDDVETIREIAASGWSRTVRFRETIEKVYEDGARIFVEVGPRGNLKSFIDDILRSRNYLAVASNLQRRSGILQLHHLLGQLAVHDVPLRLQHLYDRRDVRPLETSATPRPKRRLKLGIEPMSLPADFELPRKPHPPVLPVAPEPAPARKFAAAAAASTPTSGNGHHSLVEQPPTPMPAFALSAPIATGRAVVMEQQLATMRQFLLLQQQVVGTALAQRQQRARTAVPHDATPQVFPTPVGRLLPLISEVLELIPGKLARSIYRVAPEPLFDHHALGRDVSSEDPELTGLSIIPLTVSVEILAEAAAVLEPGKVVVEMRNMRSQRWVMIHPPLPVLEMTAEQIEPGVVQVKMRDADNSKPIRPVWMEATVVLAEKYPSPGPPMPFALQDPKPSKWAEGTLYPWGMFHGPRMRGVIRLDRTARNGASATLEILPSNQLLHGNPKPGFVLDPVTIDAVGQISGFWSQEHLDPVGDCFPYFFSRLKCFSAPPPAGTRVEGRVIIKEAGERDLRCDLEVLDSEGRVFFQVEDWTDRRFPQWTDLWAFRAFPRDAMISQAAPELLGPQNHSVVCARLDRFAPGYLEASFGVWQKMLAGLILSRKEREFWRQMNGADAQLSQWVLGRCVAKDAVRSLVSQRLGVSLFPADITVLPDAEGRPRVSGGWAVRLGLTPAVSIAYCGSLAVSIACTDPNALLGIDVQQIQNLQPQSDAAGLSDEEHALVEKLAPALRNEWLLRLSTAKKALAKALGHDPSKGTRNFAALALEPHRGIVQVSAAGGQRFSVFTVHENGYIYATICIHGNARND